MSNQFKPGDLAIVIRAVRESLLGRCVEVLDTLIDEAEEYSYRGHCFKGDADGSPSAFIDFGGGIIAFFDQKNLMPLRGDFQPEQQKSMEVEHG